MAIIYSYPSETNIQSSDLLVGTSTVVTNGKQENVTRNYSIQNITDYIRNLGGLGVTSIAFSTPLTGGTITTTGTVGITQSGNATDGYLSSADWTTFNNKLGGVSGVQDAITYWSSTTSLGSSSLSEPSGGSTVTSSKTFAPTTDASTDIGITGTQRWRNLFLSGTANAVNFTGTNLTLTGTLSANGSVGTGGFILQSQGGGAVQWVDLSTAYDTYDLNAGPKAGTSIPLNLTSTSGTDNSIVSLTQGTNITLDRNSATQVTINSTDEFQGTVTSVTTDTPNTILVAGTAVAPTLSTVTAAPGAANNGLSTGAQIQQAINDALTGLVEFKGGYNATTNAPILDNRGAQIPAAVGDYYVVTVAGTFYTETVEIGDSLICQTATAAGAGTLANWVTVQSNIGVATETVQGIANFPTAGGLTITTGAVSAKGFASVAIAGNAGYVPDSTAAAANTFLAKDGTWTIGPASGVSNITFNTGLTGGTISAGGSTVTVDYSTATNVILASGADTTAIIDSDTFLFGTGNNVGYGVMSALKTYIGAGAGTVTGSGTQYTIPVWNNGAGTAIGNSMIAQNAGGSIATVTGALTTTGTLTMPSITDTTSNTGGAGQVLTAGSGGGSVEWGDIAGYTSWNLAGDSGTPIAITDTTTANIKGSAAGSNAGIVTAVGGSPATGTITISLVGQATATATNFYRGDGTFAVVPSGAPTITKQLFTATAGQTNFTLTVNPDTIAYVNVFVSGVYQDTNSVSVLQNGAVKDVVFGSPGLSLGTIIECVSTT